MGSFSEGERGAVTTVRYRGVLAVRDDGESTDVLHLDPDGEPLAGVISDDMEDWGRYLSVRYWTAAEPHPDSEIEEGALRSLLGAGDVRYDVQYSERTGYLWTDEDIKVGGHDLLAELSAAAGSYLLLEVTYHREGTVTYADRLLAYLALHPGAGVPELASATGVTNERARIILRGAERAGQAERFRRTPKANVWSWRRTGARPGQRGEGSAPCLAADGLP